MALSPDRCADQRRAARIGFDVLVRCTSGASRATVMLKDMTRYGARIDGLSATQVGEAISLILPALPPRLAFVLWTHGRSAGLEFAEALDSAHFDAIIRDFAVGRQPPPAPPARGGGRVAA